MEDLQDLIEILGGEEEAKTLVKAIRMAESEETPDDAEILETYKDINHQVGEIICSAYDLIDRCEKAKEEPEKITYEQLENRLTDTLNNLI